jgi:AcrR family transcriptional regulator
LLSKIRVSLNKNQTSRTTIVQVGFADITTPDCLFPCGWPSDMAVAGNARRFPDSHHEQSTIVAEQIVTAKSATKIAPSSIRRLTDKGNSTATRILEEAKNILVEDGFLGLSFRAIAKRTGTTVGNIGYYYGTKDDLMVDLAEYIFDRWEFRLQRDMPPSMTDRREKFRYFIRYMIDQNKQRKTMFLLLEMWAMANRSLAVSKMMDTFYSRLRGSIDAMIAELNPKMAADTRALRAALITTQIEGLMILVGPRKPKHRELNGIEDEALAQIETMALRS